jgi:NTE family protein
MQKLALVLSGGGFKGAFQLGALEYLREHWHLFLSRFSGNAVHPAIPLHFDIVSGVSVGSLNGFMVATGQFEKLTGLWEEVEQKGVEAIYTSDFIDTRKSQQEEKLKFRLTFEILKKRFPHTTRKILLNLVFNRKRIPETLKKDLDNFRSIADNTPLREKLISFTSPNDPRHLINTITHNKCIYQCGFVPLDLGTYQSPLHHEFASDTELCHAILASTSMPIVWEPVPSISTDQQTFNESVDGGIVNVSPLGDVIREINKQGDDNEYLIVIINCSNGQMEEQPGRGNIINIALRSLVEISITEIFNNDLREFLNINSILNSMNRKEFVYDHYDWNTGQIKQKRRKRFRALVIQPDSCLGDTLLGSPRIIRERREAGWLKAKKLIENIDSRNNLPKV